MRVLRQAVPALLCLTALAGGESRAATPCPDDTWRETYVYNAAECRNGGGPSCSPDLDARCLERIGRLRTTLWTERDPGEWPSWLAFLQACKPYLDTRGKAVALTAALFDAAANRCSYASQRQVGSILDGQMSRLDVPDVKSIRDLLAGMSHARQAEWAERPEELRRKAGAEFGKVLHKAAAPETLCDAADCRNNLRISRAYACLYRARLDHPGRMPPERVREAEACAAAHIRGLGAVAEAAGVTDAIRRLTVPDEVRASTASVADPVNVGLPGDPIRQLEALVGQIRSAAAAERDDETARLLRYARDMVARNRLAIARHEHEGRSWLSAAVEEVFERSFANAVAAADWPDRVADVAEDRRRFEIVRFFQSDCGFDGERTRDPEGPARALREPGTWIMVVSRIGNSVHAIVLASSPGSDSKRVVERHTAAEAELRPLLDDWRRITTSVKHGQSPKPPSADAQRLLQRLVGDIPQRLGQKVPARFIIVPDAWAAGIPFAALPLREGGDVLARTTDIVMMPSLEYGPWPAEAPGGATAPGAPRILAGALAEEAMANEVRDIAAMFPGATMFLGDRFRLEALLDAGARQPVDVLHLATHAAFTRDDGASVSFAGGALGNASDIDRLVRATRRGGKPSLALLTMSACETGVGSGTGSDAQSAGPGVGADGQELGMLSMALRTGARASVGTLWQVHSASTGPLMREFYANLKAGCDKAAALRLAQRAVSAHPGWSHPYYWAGFVVSGDWSSITAPASCKAGG
ncbi:CHAT domain-containing protein [Azospirillum sp. TSO22-1]|uniref:CHAT domain-containing protein n=1 Tax=Azospirillum sp. TSO22-1 TaxID=716789 RepID=UPI001304C1A5|nr:CHAT domain-containing protein [Azospirillum sp. TSO22-1]